MSKIPARTIDSVIPREQVEGAKLLFKMDIEGYESRAFGGFWETIEVADLAVGLIEFDTTYIREAGENPELYYARLCERFDIHRLSGRCAGTLIKVASFADLPVSKTADNRVHTDLLLSTRGAPSDTWLPTHWVIAES